MSTILSDYLYADEAAQVESLLAALPWDTVRAQRVTNTAVELVNAARATRRKAGELESFLQHYSLTTDEGLALMSMAEALLRIPDSHTAAALIRDKIGAADWALDSKPEDWMVRAAGLGMAISRKTLDSLVARLGEPVIRQAMLQAIRLMGRQFVMGQTIADAKKNAKNYERANVTMSYDMLGEGARTRDDAERYYAAYRDAIRDLAQGGNTTRAGISVKLSALHPRYRMNHADQCTGPLIDMLTALSREAAAANIPLTVDAEEVERLEISLNIIKAVAADIALKDWDGFGLAVQAYSKRSLYVIDHLEDITRTYGRRLTVRLVKGAYWDSEIKRAQILGVPDYPVFTRKVNTDLSYLACAHKLLARRDVFYPMFATHNAHSIAGILDMAGTDRSHFEFQRLHGMGEALYENLVKDGGVALRVYAPVGTHQDLLPYLVRRLLENGANSNFVNQMLDQSISARQIVRDPVVDAATHPRKRNAKIPKPSELFAPQRQNSIGLDLTDRATTTPLLHDMKKAVDGKAWEAAPMIGGKFYRDGTPRPVVNPADWHRIIGTVWYADERLVKHAFDTAKLGFAAWSATPARTRAAALEKLADLLDANRAEIMGLCVREAGKTVDDALAEIREAADFCRYYAQRGRVDFMDGGRALPGPTGEKNSLHLEGRGVFVCISPWNFPLAIFLGQVAAALMAGNAVIAKPAEQTPMIAVRIGRLMLDAGIPPDVISILPGDGATGAMLVGHADVAGVAFTGSTEVARLINRSLAERDGPIVPLIAETGGQNVMLVDSSALPEQVVDDVITSAFGSAGQRCSALRVLYLQDDIAGRVITMLSGAMQDISIGNPMDLSSDVGPVIDEDARAILLRHREKLDGFGKKIAEAPLADDLVQSGYFFAPIAYEIDSIKTLEREVFGPVLHVIRYAARDLDRVLGDIAATGYGLTLGVHSRVSGFTDHIARVMPVGNVYINRTMIGAVVGVQPFGGRGLSGTGPKAGGPYYLHRFSTEKTVTENTAASGGNASLIAMAE